MSIRKSSNPSRRARAAAVTLAVGAALLGIRSVSHTAPLHSAHGAKPSAPADASLRLASQAFTEGKRIPNRFTCDGADLSPELNWSDPPAGTQSFALIVDDPDAPGRTFVHWVIFNLDGQTRELSEGVPKQETVEGGARQGRNDFEKIGYNGPCPPPGRAHRYLFKLYALDTKLNLPAGATKSEVEAAVEGHILARGQLMGRHGR